MSSSLFSKDENAFQNLLDQFGVSENVEEPEQLVDATEKGLTDFFSNRENVNQEKSTNSPNDTPSVTFDELPLTQSNETAPKKEPTLFDDLLKDVKPVQKKPTKKEPEPIPDKSEEYRVPNDVLHLDKVPEPDNSWEAEAADIIVPNLSQPKGATPKGASPSVSPKGASPKGASPKGASPKGMTPKGATPGASPKGATPGASPKGAIPGASPKGATPKGAIPGTSPKGITPNPEPSDLSKLLDKPSTDNFNPFIKKEQVSWSSPTDIDYDLLAEKVADKILEKLITKLGGK